MPAELIPRPHEHEGCPVNSARVSTADATDGKRVNGSGCAL